MKTIKECFPDLSNEHGWLSNCPSRVELLASCGADVLVDVEEGSYQGQGFVLLKRGDEYGYVNYWYGSCSGCDSLMAAHTIEDIERERSELVESIQWDRDRSRLLEHIKADRPFSDSNWDDASTHPDFLVKAMKVLS